MIDRFLPGVSRRAALALAIAMAGSTLLVLPLYPGRVAALMTFGVAAIGLAVVGCVVSRSAFFSLLAAFLCIGHWAKLVLHLLGGDLIEPIGAFDASPEAWDRVLLVSAEALGATALAMTVCIVFHRRFASAQPKALASYGLRSAVPIFVLSAVAAAILFGLNRWYAILCIGFEPRIELNSYVYVAFSFVVSWGAMIWLGALAFWLVRQGIWPVDSLFHLAAIEGALASMSMASRAQMILHVLAVLIAYFLWRDRFQWQLSVRRWIAVGGITGALFAGSIVVVSIDRTLSFTVAIPQVVTASQPPRADNRAVKEKMYAVVRELSHLVIMRWVGLEGVMATTAADGLGMPLFLAAIKERPQAGNDAIYQRLSNSRYVRMQGFVFLTLPGAVAVLALSGSHLIVAFGMALLVISGRIIEFFALICTGNPVVASVAGCALAFLIVNMNVPHTLLIFSLTLMAAIGLIGLFRAAVHVLSVGSEDRCPTGSIRLD